MSFQIGINPAKRQQLFSRESSRFSPSCVEHRSSVALGENEDIIRIGARTLWIEAHNREKKRRYDLCRGCATRGVPAASFRSGAMEKDMAPAEPEPFIVGEALNTGEQRMTIGSAHQTGASQLEHPAFQLVSPQRPRKRSDNTAPCDGTPATQDRKTGG